MRAASTADRGSRRVWGREHFQADPPLLRPGPIDNRHQELPINGLQAAAVHHPRPIRKNPFDRMLAAQGMVEGVILLTADPVAARCPGPLQAV